MGLARRRQKAQRRPKAARLCYVDRGITSFGSKSLGVCAAEIRCEPTW
jgi:hypothetical protein